MAIVWTRGLYSFLGDLFLLSKSWISSAHSDVYRQIDIAPTVSVLLGLPIPSSSIGALIPEMLTGLTADEQLYMLHYNAKRLLGHILASSRRITVSAILVGKGTRIFFIEMVFVLIKFFFLEYYIQYNEAVLMHKAYLRSPSNEIFKKAKLLYVSSSREMSSELSTKFIKYDHLTISIAVVVTTMVRFKKK